MSRTEMVRALKDKKYRKSRETNGNAGMNENPAGAVELSDAELGGVTGGHCHYGIAVPRTIHLSCASPDCSLVAPTQPDYNGGATRTLMS